VTATSDCNVAKRPTVTSATKSDRNVTTRSTVTSTSNQKTDRNVGNPKTDRNVGRLQFFPSTRWPVEEDVEVAADAAKHVVDAADADTITTARTAHRSEDYVPISATTFSITDTGLQQTR